MLIADRVPGLGHAFTNAAFLEKGPFQFADLLVQQVTGLGTQTNHNIPNNLRVITLHIGPVGLIRRIVPPQRPHRQHTRRILGPDRQATNEQEIFIVFQ